ncbi:MAG: hypothetical protein Q8O55_08740 [Dehalococcoidales bacterium]|nr:hypothetical protein [Dehalococcoidales bacterium]
MKPRRISPAYFARIENELHSTIKPNPEFFDGAEKEKLLEAQAKGQSVEVRVMLTHKKEIDETFIRIIALEDEGIRKLKRE